MKQSMGSGGEGAVEGVLSSISALARAHCAFLWGCAWEAPALGSVGMAVVWAGTPVLRDLMSSERGGTATRTSHYYLIPYAIDGCKAQGAKPLKSDF